jgi:two-component system, OmpR family, heavy metal sensor histidine kinase CusS
VSGDRLMIRRALSNLLSNAVRHAESDSIVVISVDNLGDRVELSVSNRGAEIPVQAQRRLFERFVRLSSGRSRDATEGVGLGLPITKAIMLAHRGQVTARSSQGINTFSLIFPPA